MVFFKISPAFVRVVERATVVEYEYRVRFIVIADVSWMPVYVHNPTVEYNDSTSCHFHSDYLGNVIRDRWRQVFSSDRNMQ
jgi:hypothetical protein